MNSPVRNRTRAEERPAPARRRGARRIAVAAAVLGVLSAGAPSAEVAITLDEAVRSAIEKNLDLRVETYRPAISETGVRRAGAIYNTRLGLQADRIERTERLSPALDCVARTHDMDFDLSAERLLATGADARLSYTNLWSLDNFGTPLSRTWRPELSLSVSQPILAGFGREVTERGMTAASDAMESALAAWRNRAIGIAADARTQYFTVIKARDDLETRRASLVLARQVHAENQARARAGILAEIELLDSELGVAQREKDLLDAEKNDLEQADRLRVLIQAPPGSSIFPADPYPEGPSGVSDEEATAVALRLRPDLVGARIALRTSEFQARVSRNLALPSLSVNGAAGVSGLGRDFGSAADDLGGGRFPFWSLGLSFSYPLGNDAAEADLAAARLQARQAEAAIRSLEESVGLDVRTAVRELGSKRQQIDVAQKGVTLAEARLASYHKRQKLGLATTKDLLQVESDLATARVALSAARADYHTAVTQLYKSTGELLEKHGIRIDDRAILDTAWKELR